MSKWKCSYGKVCECKGDVEKSKCDLAYKTKKMSKEEIIELINEHIEYYTGDEMKSISESVGDSRIISELNDIKNKILNQNKEDDILPTRTIT
jgi:hypothetical protein